MQDEDKPEQEKAKMNVSPTPSDDTQVRTGAKRPPPLTTDIRAHIGRRLAAVYDEVLLQPVPDRFRLLLDALEQKTGDLPKPAPDKPGDA